MRNQCRRDDFVFERRGNVTAMYLFIPFLILEQTMNGILGIFKELSGLM
jgi:hypothetical protein